jgi:glycogen debranching enzyme
MNNAVIALGLDRYGLKSGVLQILTAMFDASTYIVLQRLPELSAVSSGAATAPIFYPVACAPQAWATAAPFALLQAALGLTLTIAVPSYRFRKPALRVPRQLSLSNLRLGNRAVIWRLRGTAATSSSMSRLALNAHASSRFH